jgi:hypothetical protein
MVTLHKDFELTHRSLPPPKSLCVLVRGEVIGIEGDFLCLQDAQDIFYTIGDQRVGTARQGGPLDEPWRWRRAACDAIVVRKTWMGGETMVVNV